MRELRIKPTFIPLIAAALLVAPSAAYGGAPDALAVTGALYGKPKKSGEPAGDRAEDISGLACAPPSGQGRVCLMVDDESQGAQIVILEKGRLVAGTPIRLITDTFDGKPVELDPEGVAFAGRTLQDGAFYVTGSHGRPRRESDQEEPKNQAKARASMRVFKVRFPAGSVDVATGRLASGAAADVTPLPSLAATLQAHEPLKTAFGVALEDNGLTIEGLAVDANAAHFGFRGPVPDDGKAVVLQVSRAGLDGSAPPAPRIIPLALGKDGDGHPRGIRDLVATSDGFWGIAGPVQDPPAGQAIRCGDYAIFAWRATDGAIRMQDLPPFPAATADPTDPKASDKVRPLKPEGLTLLMPPVAGPTPALLVFDGPADGRPTPVAVDFRTTCN